MNKQLLAEVWDGQELKLSFRRNFSPQMMNQWRDLEQIISSVSLNTEHDSMT